MQKIEKTVFLSYRHSDSGWATAIFKDLTQHGFDVFIDFDGLASGDFTISIAENIKGRAHFVVLLTPCALMDCSKQNDWLRREIETALDSKRNIIPLLLDKASFASSEFAKSLTGKMSLLRNYQGLEIVPAYFDSGMERLREKFLNLPVSTVLHPISVAAQKEAERQHGEALSSSDSGEEPTEHLEMHKHRGPTMKARLSACKNQEAIEFFKRESGRNTNSNKNALIYKQEDKIHWYVWPIPTGATVLQIDRFTDDDRTWSKLSKPNPRPLNYEKKANLRFDLISAGDFEEFTKVAEGELLSWRGPQTATTHA